MIIDFPATKINLWNSIHLNSLCDINNGFSLLPGEIRFIIKVAQLYIQRLIHNLFRPLWQFSFNEPGFPILKVLFFYCWNKLCFLFIYPCPIRFTIIRVWQITSISSFETFSFLFLLWRHTLFKFLDVILSVIILIYYLRNPIDLFWDHKSLWYNRSC